jgi:hypothetical protein
MGPVAGDIKNLVRSLVDQAAYWDIFEIDGLLGISGEIHGHVPRLWLNPFVPARNPFRLVQGRAPYSA